MLQEKRNRVVKWIHDKTHICTAMVTHFRSKDSQTESEGNRKRYSMQKSKKMSEYQYLYLTKQV